MNSNKQHIRILYYENFEIVIYLCIAAIQPKEKIKFVQMKRSVLGWREGNLF